MASTSLPGGLTLGTISLVLGCPPSAGRLSLGMTAVDGALASVPLGNIAVVGHSFFRSSWSTK
eukprot:8554519-Prorocentrum_lima.AAC.1